VWLGKPEPDRPTREETPVSTALITLHKAMRRLPRPGLNITRMDLKLLELAECFDIANDVVRKP
jgi:hypothetical protein